MTTMFRKTVFRPGAITIAAFKHALESPPQSLADAVQKIVLEIPEHRLESLPLADSNFGARLMLGLLVYCYARQVFSSSEIEAMLAADDACSRLWGSELPAAAAIRQFRDANRAPVQECLRSALLFLAQRKVADGTVTRINESFVAEEARRRIIMGMCADSMECPTRVLTDIA